MKPLEQNTIFDFELALFATCDQPRNQDFGKGEINFFF